MRRKPVNPIPVSSSGMAGITTTVSNQGSVVGLAPVYWSEQDDLLHFRGLVRDYLQEPYRTYLDTISGFRQSSDGENVLLTMYFDRDLDDPNIPFRHPILWNKETGFWDFLGIENYSGEKSYIGLGMNSDATKLLLSLGERSVYFWDENSGLQAATRVVIRMYYRQY